MGSSLAHCITLADLHPIEAKKLEDAAAIYREEGFKAREANTGAVKDIIKTLEAERRDILGQVKKQIPEYFEKPKEIKKPEPEIVPEVEEKIPKESVAEKEISQLDLVKRYVKETGKKVEKGELDKVKGKYPEEWAKAEEAEVRKKELWNKLPESFRRNRGINEYTTEELEKKVAELELVREAWEIKSKEWVDKHIKSPAMHREHVSQALKSGKLTPEKYAELHEKDYGPFAEFMPEDVKKPKITKPEIILEEKPTEKYAKFLESVGYRFRSEEIGQDILDTLQETDISPTDVSTRFWKKTYPSLPKKLQKTFENYLYKLTNMKPGDPIATKNGETIYSESWQDIAEDFLPNKIEHLEGPERGYVALMTDAVNRFAKPKVVPKPKKEPLSETKFRLLANIKSEKGSSELINDLSRLGADAMRRGHTTYEAFTAEMKIELSNVWEKIKSLMRKAFFQAKQILKSEKGAVELRNPFASQVTDESSTGMSLFDDLEVERTYAQRINTERDEAVYQVDRRTLELERQVKELTGTGKRKGVIGWRISAERIKFSEFRARQLSRAMFYYREAQINPEKAKEFEGWAVKELETARGERKLRIKTQLATYRQSQNLTDEQKRFVDETMDQAFSDVSDEAIKSGIITRTKENYVRRIWNLSKNRAGLAKYGFKTFTTAQLQRKFETIYDGFVRDMDLKVSGIVSSYGEIAGEVAVIKANKNFIQASMDIGILTTDSKKPGYIPLNASGFSAWARKAGAKIKTRPDEPGLLQIDTHGRKIFFAPPTLKYGAIKPGATRVSRYFPTMEMAEEWIEKRDEPYRIDRVQQADVFEKVTLYAPERIGEMLNQMTRAAGGMFETPVMRNLLRFNAGIKGWILMSSFFHHMAGQRSWAFGVNHEIADNLKKGNIVQAIKNVGTMVNSVSAHKRGLQKIEANSAQLALLVRQGLTLGKMQDWDEALLREQKGLTETFIHTLGAERIAGVMEKGRIKREMFTNSLFRRFFAGLKAEAAVTEFNYRVKRATMKGKTPDTNLIAEQVARLINADFGGLHLTRMGRSKDMQKMLRLLLLAPDWTESNFRTFTGMIPGANKTINRIIGDMPPPPGMEKVYRGFWGGVIIKASLATMMAQAVADLWNDDDEGWRKDEFFNNFRRMKWTGVNVTGLYRSLGVDVPENERRIFSVVGHFADPLKIMHPPKLIKGKGSPLTRIAEAAMSKSDWRERPYTSFGEWAATGKLKKKSRYEPRENFWVALPSIAIDQTISMQPIQFGHLLRYWMGEEDGLSALLSSGGAHITTAYKPRKPKPGRGPLKGGLSGGRLRGRLKGRLQ